ncbi:MarR family transcriptional regulator [Leifsonia lichenia]
MAQRLSTHDLSTAVRIAVARLSRRLRAEKADDELSDTQTSALAFLVREGSGTIGQLSEHERVKPPSMNRTINCLEEAGYVRRTPDADDGRKVVVVPTEEGRALIAETRRRRDAWLHKRLRELTPGQRATLADAAAILRELADS